MEKSRVVAIDQAAETFAGVLVDNRGDLDGPAVGGGVELEVDGQTQFGASAVGRFGVVEVPVRLRRRRCGTRGGLPRATAANLLVVHHPALTAGVVVSVAEAAPWVVLGPGS